MRQRFLCLLVLYVPLLLIAQGTTLDSNIKWTEGLSWKQINVKAKQEHKYIFVDAYTTWCAPCKVMDKVVFANDTIAQFFNSNFISVKAQMDTTSSDNGMIKLWYSDAHFLLKSFKITSYPTFLFFSPAGTLAFRESGSKDVQTFLKIAKQALGDPFSRYSDQLNKFRSGQLEFNAMPELARMAKKQKDNSIAYSVAREYKRKYLDNLNGNEAFKKDNLLFIVAFNDSILTSDDRYFRFFFDHASEADSLMKYEVNGVVQPLAEQLTFSIIKKEEINDKLYSGAKIKHGFNPNWKLIHRSIRNKYGKSYVEKFLPEEQVRFYAATKDWRNFTKYVKKKILLNPPKAGGRLFGQSLDSWELNVYAWQLFTDCLDKKLLKDALKWSELSIQLSIKENKSQLPDPQYLDTKANLLYKLGKVQEAIEVEKIALRRLKPESQLAMLYKSTIEKMEKGIPTWQ